MKKLSIVFLLFVVLFYSCKDNNQSEEAQTSEVQTGAESSDYLAVGETFDAGTAVPMSRMEEMYRDLPVGDTLEVKVISKVKEVCEKKGCWMKLENGSSDEVMVKMKDYAFFVPKDVEGKEVIVSGKAYVTEMSVEDQKHYAEDGGRPDEEIAAITEPKRTFSFMADGVMIKE